MIEINGMAHVILSVSRFEESRAFYKKLLPFLGLEEVFDGDEFVYHVGARTALGIQRCSEGNEGQRFEQGSVGLHHLCFRARSREDVSLAESFFRRALELEPRLTDPCLALAEVHEIRGDFEQALDQAYRGLRLAEAHGDPWFEAEANNRVGAVYLRIHHLGKAREYLEKAYDKRVKLQNQEGVWRSLSNLGVLARREGDLDTARQRLEGALELVRSLGDREAEAGLLGNLAVVLANLGLAGAARENYVRALELCRGIGDHRGAGLVLDNMAMVVMREDPEQGLALMKEALEIFEELGECSEVARVHQNLGWMLQKSGKADEARRMYLEGLEEARRASASFTICSLKLNLAGMELEEGRAEAASEGVDGLMEELEVLGGGRARIGLYWQLCEIEEQLGRDIQARRALRTAFDLLNALLNHLPDEDSRSRFLALDPIYQQIFDRINAPPAQLRTAD